MSQGNWNPHHPAQAQLGTSSLHFIFGSTAQAETQFCYFGRGTQTNKDNGKTVNSVTHLQSHRIQRQKPSDSHREQCTHSGKKKT